MTLPVARTARPASPDHTDPARGRGRLPRARIPRRRRPRGRDDPLQLRRAQLPAGHPARSPQATLFLDDETVLRTETSPSQIRTWRRKSHRSTSSLSGALSPRHAGRDAHADLPPGGRARRRRGDHARRPRSGRSTSAQGAVRPGAAHRVPDALLPVHRAVDRGIRVLPRLRRRRLPGLPSFGLDRARWRGHGRSEAVRVRRLRPGAVHRLRVRAGASSGLPCCGTSSPTCGSSGATTSASRGSSDESPRSPGCASTSRRPATPSEIARRLAISSLEVERVIEAGVADRDGNLGSSSSDACSPPSRTRTPTGSSSARSTSAIPTRSRSSAERGTSASERRSPSASPGRCCPGFPARSRSGRCGERSRGG